MSPRATIVTLATAWGPRFGGINAFNAELTKSLGILPTRDYDLVCVVPGAATPDIVEECRQSFSVQLISLEAQNGEFTHESPSHIARRLDVTRDPARFLWIGHDDKTGPLALELRSLATGSNSILINHMAHGAYQSVKTGKSRSAAKKRKLQLQLFKKADLCLAVGPMLKSHLEDMLASETKRPPVEMLVPGLSDPNEYGVDIRDAAPENFVAFVAGRLGSDDDRIKQGRLAVSGFGMAVGSAERDSAIRSSPTLRMRGVAPMEETSLRDLLMNAASQAVNFDFQEYTDDRGSYFRDLASSSVAMMPSWHEGFGLTAWEAIASAVPVVISEESGVYRLLRDACSGAGLDQSIAHVHVGGWLPSQEDEPNYTAEDVNRVADALRRLAQPIDRAKQQALTLRRNLLTLGLDWKGTALTFLAAIESHLGVPLTGERSSEAAPSRARPAIAVETDIPDWLRLPERRPWRPDLGLPTSMLLAARDEIVRFDPEREPFLAQNIEWAARQGDLSARLLFAPGGMGKTRLAIELARRLQEVGWLSVWLSSAAPDAWIETWRNILSSGGQRPVLMVIDYADARPADVLAALGHPLLYLRDATLRAPVRLLLLARSESWLSTLPHHASCGQDLAAWLSIPASIEPLALPLWSSERPRRLASYERALVDYAAALRVATPPNAYVPRLDARLFDRPLYLHMAALAALEGQRPPSADALLRDQLQREWLYWLRRHGERVVDYDDWADAMACVVLCQGANATQLRLFLELLGIHAPDLVSALQRSYPSDADGIAALEPDLLAEALLRERLAERRAAPLLDSVLGRDSEQFLSAMSVVARLAAQVRTFEADQTPGWARVLVAALARNWPHHTNEWLIAAHISEHGLGELLFAAWRQIDASTRQSMAEELSLPTYSTNLMRLTVAVRDQQRLNATNPESRAGTLNDLAVALSYLGDAASRTEALACARESVQIRRQLAETQPTAYVPYLAVSLNNLANHLSAQGDADSRAEALAFAREVVAIYRQLAETQPATYLPSLAGSLNNLASHLSAQGDAPSRAEALACAYEAVPIYRQLAEAQPVAYLQDLALSLNNLANHLSAQGDAPSRAEALGFARESLEIRRQLAETQPAAYLPDLARSLNSVANHMSQQGDAASRTEATAFSREAVAIDRQLAETHPAAFLPNLAGSLNNLATQLFAQGDAPSRAEALALAIEAVAIYRQVAETQPAAYVPALAGSLLNLAEHLSAQGDVASRAEALAYAHESLQIRRQLAETQPAAYLAELADSLNNLAIRLSEQGGAASRAEALAFARESLDIRRQLAETQPAAYLPDLGASLNNLANHLFAQGDAAYRTEALALALEAVAIYREVAETQPAAYMPALALSLLNLAEHLSAQGDVASRAEALGFAREAVAIYRQLVKTQPAAYLRALAVSLNNLTNHLSKQGDAPSSAEALVCVREAVAIYLQLAETQPAAYLAELAESLNNLGIRLSAQGDAASRSEALACARKSVQIRRQLAETEPAAHLPNLARSLNSLGIRLFEQGDAASRAEALVCARESVQIRRQLVETQPAAYLPNLAASLDNLANRLSEQGDASSRAEALACARESVEIRRQLVEAQPAAYLPDLALSLNNLGHHLFEQGDIPSRAEALACTRESVQIRRQLARIQPAAYLPDLAMSLNNLGLHLSVQGDAPSRAEALACVRESVQIRRQLAQTQPAAYLPNLALSLNNLANHLCEQGDARSRVEALACARESAQIYALLHSSMPAAFERYLRMAINTLARAARENGQDPEEVINAAEEVINAAIDALRVRDD